MTTIISTGSFIITILFLSLTPVAGSIGDNCNVTNACPANEVCGSSSTCECLDGYKAIVDQCARECPELQQIASGTVSVVPNAEKVEFEAVYTCTDGYELEGKPNRRCLNTSVWEGSAPTCRKKVCPPLEQPSNGNMTYSDSRGEFESIATYTCNSGFELSGTATRTCQTDGQWSGTAPTCEEIIDPCKPNPCPQNADSVQYPCVTNTEDSSTHVCICPVGKKGSTCTEDDPPLTCRAFRNKLVHFENNPSEEDRTGCMPRKSSTVENVCYNPNEDIVYEFDGTDDISVLDSADGKFCVRYRATPPDVAETCVSIMAFEADDIIYRPWINETFQFCFKFNDKPNILFPLPSKPLRYNAADMPDTVTVNLQANDTDVNQTLSWSISAVGLVEFEGKFSIKDNKLEISSPAELYTTNPDIFGQIFDVEITVKDSGVPSLQDSVNASIQFVHEVLTCTIPDDPLLVHLNPLPTNRVNLGQIQCTADGESQTPQLEITNDAGPVVIEPNGTIFYDPAASETRGKFNVNVKANVTLTLPVSTTVNFAVFASNFNPNCSRTDAPLPVSLSEKAVIGTCYNGAIFTCDDPANLIKTCTDDSDQFNVECTSVSANISEVKICSAVSLDNFAGETRTVSVNVANKFGVETVEINVTISNVNDPPTFVTDASQIDIEIPENITVQTVIGEVLPVDDPDIAADPSFDNLSVTITDLENKEDAASLPFEAIVNSFVNAVTVNLKDDLNPKVRHSYMLELKVEDKAGESDTVKLNITVQDLNEKPTCESSEVNTSATVRDTVDYVVTRLTCTDNDFSASFGSLSYSLEGEISTTDYFKIDSVGVIRLEQDLTSFTNVTKLSFSARVTDGGGLTESVQITVDVKTSYPPECEKFDVTEEKSEGTAAGECFLLAVKCNDPVQQEVLSFTDPSGSGTQLFTFKADSSTNDDVSLCTVDSLKDKVGHWQINLVVASAYGSRNIQIIIKVVDENDPPTCVPPAAASVSVTSDIDTLVAALICNDPDVDTNFKTLTYTLEGKTDVLAYFKIESNKIQVAKRLYEITGALNVLEFTARAEDGGGLSAYVNVTVTVNNDFPPTCNSSEYDVTTSEATDANVCFGVAVECAEPVRNEPLNFTIASGNGANLFVEKDSTNSQMTICTTKALQGQYGTWKLSVVVTSSYGETNFEVVIGVSDKNDRPVFPVSVYQSSVSENKTVGSAIVTVTATDEDSGAYGRITYHSTDIENSGVFSLDMDSGVISVASSLDADRMDSDKYFFTVTAMDGASVPLAATATVTIQVLDVNDEVPVCKQVPDAENIGLLTPIGTLIKQLNCSDADITPTFSILEYSTTSSYFTVNSTGHVVLAKELPRDVRKHDIKVKVTDTDKSTDPAFSTSVVITVFVDNKVPPVCNPDIVVRSLKETEEIDVCLDKEVICTDPTGGETIFQSQTGSARDKGLLVIKIHNETDKLGLSACISSTLKNMFGTYELIGTVSNGLATTTVNWTFTVENVNEPPVFYPDVYNVSVNEDQKLNQEILRLNITDPDDGKGNANFELDTVIAESSNDKAFDSALSSSIWFLSEVGAFYALRQFNATVRNVYKYNVMAVDKSGLKSNATVTIWINDVNSAPICEPSPIKGSTDILAKENSLVSNIFCFDTDIEPKYVQLDYQINDGDKDGYFNVTQEGRLIVQKPLPRDLLYDTGTADIQVEISDRGTPPLSTAVTVSVTVNNKIPATCKPVVIPPDVWVQGRCVTIHMDCIDPTKEGTDHLVYETSGNFTSGFSKTGSDNGTIKLCYILTTSGIFQISVTVDNGLSSYTFTDDIVVSYSQASPVFFNTKYTDTISENTEINTIVMIVKAMSANLIGNMEYNILGSESTESWEKYFSLDKSTGGIKTVTSIRDLANTIFTLKVEAVDTGSKLKSSVPVELTVEDLNERPVCDVTSTTLNLDVSSAVEMPIIVFTCSDPDVKELYRSLKYTLSGSNVETYFKLAGDPSTSVVIKAPLNVRTKVYNVTLTVSDAGTPPLAFQQVFIVNVNTLPPPVNVEVEEVSYDTVLVSWNYDRVDYYDVTNGFKVKALSTENIIVKESVNIDSGTETYNVTGLTEKTEYIIVVEADTEFGKRSSKELKVTTKDVPVLKQFTATMIANKDYNRLLRNFESQLYYTYRKEVIDNVASVLDETKGFAGITLVTFRPHNSIFVDLKGSVDELIGDVDTTIQKLNQTVSSGWVKSISVQSDYFQASTGGGYIIVDGLSFTPDNVYNGTKVALACNITTVGYSSDETFTYWWTYKGNQLQPTSQSRYSISVSTDQEFYEYKHSTLSIQPILADQSGFYGCHVRDSANLQLKEKLIEIQVVSQPIVYITPKSLTVKSGDNVNVTCTVAVSQGTFEGFVLFKNGNLFEGTSNEIVSRAPTSTTIEIKGIQQNVVYGCEGVNEAGSSERVYSNIGVVPLVPKEDEFCPEADDARGTTWSVSASDTVVRLDCHTNFTGEIYRMCTAKGTWEPSVYNCVRKELESIEQQAIDIKDGSRPLNLTQVLVDLNQATTDTPLFEGDIDTAINVLNITAGITDDSGAEENAVRKTNFIKTCSSLIDELNVPPWRSSIEVRKRGAIAVPKLVEEYSNKVLDNILQDAEESITVKNIHVMLSSIKKDKYTFPDRSGSVPEWVESSKTTIVVQGEAFKDISTLRYSGSIYRNISPILVKILKSDGVVTDVSSKYDINSDIVAFQLNGINSITIDPPVEIQFQHFDSNYSDPVCCYWDYQEEAFATDGCRLKSTDDEVTVCLCNHFTNFAVLMSPGKTPEADVMALSIISAVGCGISILCLLLTIILYAVVWRLVKSDRAVLLMNLCVALIISYIVFLAGVDRVENKNVCTAISVLLHYVYLVVFFLMLAYGIEIAISVVYVFVTRSRIRWLLPLAWGIPLVIVGISMGATQLEGYGNESFCWLSIEDGLLYAFVGPAALIILINFAIVIIVLRQMFKSSAMMTKSDKEKAVTGVRSICVLLPILGLTWVFGVLSVNEELVVFQYIFAICNSLQGFLIFLFHCILNKQLKQALRQRNERKKSLATIENTFKNQHSTTGSTSYISSENKFNENKDPIIGSSNPFLEADRQMKELVGKKKKDANVNDKLEANNRVDVEKNNKAVDLDDVKISNIIRESEVMGGMSGVSSILQLENRDGANKKEGPTLSSNTSAHRYDYIDTFDADNPPSTGIQKPPGYEKLLQGTSQGFYASKDSVQTGSDRSREREKVKQREKERDREFEIERERQKRIEKEKRDRFERERLERERMEKENDERERRQREQREKERYKDKNVIRIGYTNDGYNTSEDRRRDGSHDRRVQPRSARSSRTDDDYESGSSTQNITSISTALPEKFELYQGKKRQQKEAKKHESSLKRKEKKKSSLKDRSKAYEHPYESTYLGGQSRHASLENMNTQNIGYSPYAQMPAGYQTGRPAIQQQQWDQYGYARGPRDPRDPYDPYARDPYRRDYW